MRRFSGRMRKLVWWAFFYAAVLFLLFVFLFPIVWTVMTSLKTEADAFSMPPNWFFTPTFENYKTIFTEQPFWRYILNSMVISFGSTFVALLVGTPAAYALTRFNFRGRDDMAFYILSTRIAPPTLVLLPFFLIFRQYGLIDTYIGMIMVYLTFNISFVVWLMKGFFEDVPTAIDEAAVIDGCNRFGAFVRIVLPLSLGGLTSTAIFSAIMAWNEFLFALVLTGNNTETLPVAITSFIQFTGTRWGELTAAATIIMTPMVLFSFFIQRRLVRGLTMGAVK